MISISAQKEVCGWMRACLWGIYSSYGGQGRDIWAEKEDESVR